MRQFRSNNKKKFSHLSIDWIWVLFDVAIKTSMEIFIVNGGKASLTLFFAVPAHRHSIAIKLKINPFRSHSKASKILNHRLNGFTENRIFNCKNGLGSSKAKKKKNEKKTGSKTKSIDCDYRFICTLIDYRPTNWCIRWHWINYFLVLKRARTSTHVREIVRPKVRTKWIHWKK